MCKISLECLKTEPTSAPLSAPLQYYPHICFYVFQIASYFQISRPNFVNISQVSHAFYMLRSFNIPMFDYSNVTKISL